MCVCLCARACVCMCVHVTPSSDRGSAVKIAKMIESLEPSVEARHVVELQALDHCKDHILSLFLTGAFVCPNQKK